MAKILLVEDGKTVKFMTRLCLESEQHNVDTAETVKAAVSLLRSNLYDLIIMDWNLPDGNGIQICKMYRRTGGTAPILMLTNRASKADLIEALDRGADDYLVKPFDSGELLSRVRAHLRRRNNFLLEELNVSDWELDSDSLEVSNGEITVQLDQNEYVLMRVLMRHPNRSFSLEELSQHASASSYENFDVNACLETLRKKLGDANKCIYFSEKNGYSFRLGCDEEA